MSLSAPKEFCIKGVWYRRMNGYDEVMRAAARCGLSPCNPYYYAEIKRGFFGSKEVRYFTVPELLEQHADEFAGQHSCKLWKDERGFCQLCSENADIAPQGNTNGGFGKVHSILQEKKFDEWARRTGQPELVGTAVRSEHFGKMDDFVDRSGHVIFMGE